MVVDIEQMIDSVIGSECDQLVILGRNTKTDHVSIWSTHSAQDADDLVRRYDAELERLNNA